MTDSNGEKREKGRIAEGMSDAGAEREPAGGPAPGGSGPDLEQAIRERAHALWEADGRPEGRETEYWIQAEQEVANQSAVGEEDPLEGLDHLTPGSTGRSGTG